MLRGPNGAYDQVHLGVGAASADGVCVGLYGLWHNRPREEFGQITCDLGLLVSNDGLRFREPVKGYRFLRHEDSPAPSATEVPSSTVLCQANGIVNVGGETRIYHGRWRNIGLLQPEKVLKHYYAEVTLATLPRDRWGALALNPQAAEGAIASAVIHLPADASLGLNADGADGIRIDVTDEGFRPIAGFSGDQAGRAGAAARNLVSPVNWPDRSLARLGGMNVRLLLRLRRGGGTDPWVYALYLKP